MIIQDFLVKNWFDLLQSLFIVGGFMITSLSIMNDIRSRKIEHLLHINQSYREIWGKTYSQPELLRIRESNLDLNTHPITEAERRMAREIIIHIYAVYEAINSKQIDKGEMDKDIYDYLHLPIPNAIWQEVKVYHQKQFVKYIDELLQKRKTMEIELI